MDRKPFARGTSKSIMQVDTAGTDASEIKNSVKLVNESDVKPNLGLVLLPPQVATGN